MKSWSWIASVFTRPWNKAFLSVFLVFGIWDFGLVVIFFFLSLCFPPRPPPQVHFWFQLILPTLLPSDPQLVFKIILKKKNKIKKNSLHFHPFCCPCRHSFVTPYSYYLCDFWLMRASMLLCRLVVQESLVCFSSERKRDWRGAMRTSAVIGKEKRKKKGPTLPFFPSVFLDR